MNSHNRRRVLKGLAAGLAMTSVPSWGAQSGVSRLILGTGSTTPFGSSPELQRPLPIPSESTGEPDASGTRHYKLVAGYGSSELVEGVQTPTWGYNGALLGPTLRVPQGTPVRIRVHNGLDYATTTHWHGAQVCGRMDGGPHSVIPPGGSWEAAYTLTQPASTLWYHPHTHAYTGPQVYGGLAGMLWIDDGVDERLGLPHTYGIDDIPLIIQDRRLNNDGSLAYMTSIGDVMGMKGDRFLANGVEQPYMAVGADWVRLRVLNGSNARNYNLAFGDGRVFHVVAGDAGLLAAPAAVTQLLLAPGERAQIMVDLRHDGGRRLVLGSVSGLVVPDLYRLPMAIDDHDRQGFDLLELRVGPSLDLGTRLPAQLVDQPVLEPDGESRRFLLNGIIGSGAIAQLSNGRGYRARPAAGPGSMSAGVGDKKLFAINNEFMDINVVNVRVPLGSTEVWQITNVSVMAHPFHMHGTSFLIRARNGQPPAPHESSWKDVVLVRGGETVELVARFAHPADADHAYMYHCHILEHEDNGMMGQFVVE